LNITNEQFIILDLLQLLIKVFFHISVLLLFNILS